MNNREEESNGSFSLHNSKMLRQILIFISFTIGKEGALPHQHVFLSLKQVQQTAKCRCDKTFTKLSIWQGLSQLAQQSINVIRRHLPCPPCQT